MKEKIVVHILGGLGDVSLIRKYPALYRYLSNYFEIGSVSDIYEKSRVKDLHGLDELLNDIEKCRLKGKLDPDIRPILKNALLHSTEYFQLNKDEPILPRELFDIVGAGDVFDISTPNKFHIQLARQILENCNAHLLIEKPICNSLEEAIRFGYDLAILKQRGKLDGRIFYDGEHYSYYGNVREFFNNFKRYSKDNNGFGLGRITSIELAIEEDETFSNERNRDIINKNKSGGGIWLDTGIHAIAFLRNIGAEIDHYSVIAQPRKIKDPLIEGDEYRETAMEAEFDIVNNNYFAPNCHVSISVGKGFSMKRKEFIINYEKGRVELNIANKSLTIFDENNSEVTKREFPQDAFFYVFDDLRQSITYRHQPFTSVDKALENAKGVFLIYDRARQIQILSKSEYCMKNGR